MTLIRLFYLIAAIAGAVWPMSKLWPWLAEHGLDPFALIAAWTETAATESLFADLAISASVFSIWVIVETRRNGIKSGLWAIPATWLIGLSCGLPLYLFLRTRPTA